MELDLGDPIVFGALAKYTEAGAGAGCPFCRARKIRPVSRGDRIVFLKGTHAGEQAIVTALRDNRWEEFLVHLDRDPPGRETIVNHNYAVFVSAPLDKIPSWLCSLSVDDLCEVDQYGLRLAINLATSGEGKLTPDVLLPIVAIVRQRRLPVIGIEVWRTLEAHGLPKRLKADFCSKFDFVIDVLVSLEGRRPMKKKRVPAMSVGKYQTPTYTEYFGPSPGIFMSR